jgi:transcriptional regulator with XRE-family HTH domain
MSNKEKFLTLVSKENSKSLEINRERIRNRAMLRESQQIAMKVLSRLDELGWPQKELADRMSVSPQYISKILKGKENLTIETQIALQEILDIPVLASYFENRKSVMQKSSSVIYKQDHAQYENVEGKQAVGYRGISKGFSLNYHSSIGQYSYEEVA